MSTALGSLDRQILELMQQNADLSASEIAERVGLSQSPCWRRINRMQEEGLIRGKFAALDRKRLNLDVVVFADVRLSSHGWENLAEFEQAMESRPEVLECYTMAGATDYLLKIVAPDIQRYELFVREHILRLPHIKELHSNISMSEIKFTTALPLGYCE
jgi:Lrp/AsnC family transcriptional regulator